MRFLTCVVQNRRDAPANLNIRWINQGRVVNVSEYPSLIIDTTMEDNDRIVTSTLTFNPVNYKVFDSMNGYRNNFQCEAYIGNYIFDAVRNRGALLTVNCKLIDVIEYKLVITSANSVYILDAQDISVFSPLVAPKFLLQPSSIERINLADTKELECAGTAIPQMTIMFYRHYDNGSSVLIGDIKDDVLKTTIKNANYDDAGNYSCQMSNSIGVNVSNFTIIIQGKSVALL